MAVTVQRAETEVSCVSHALEEAGLYVRNLSFTQICTFPVGQGVYLDRGRVSVSVCVYRKL